MLNGISRRTLMLVLAIVLCFSMTAGSTIAWFTETVESEKNVIQAGNLDVELYYQLQDQTTWTPVAEDTNLFKTNTLWEPGHTEVIKLKVENKGSLSLKYQLGTNVVSEIGSVNVQNNEFKLSDHIKSGVIEGDQNYSREQAVAAVDASAQPLSTSYLSGVQQLLPGKEKVVTMVVYMPTSVGNEANYAKGADVPKITLGVKLNATQLAYESDSFDNQYDAGATFEPDTSWYDGNPDAATFSISTADQLFGLAKLINSGDSLKGKTIQLASNIDLQGALWTPIGNETHWFNATFDGNGKTISNFTVEGEKNVGLFGYGRDGGSSIKNLTVKNATVKGNDYVGAILGRGYSDVENCHVEDSTIIAVPYLKGNGTEYDGGAKAGGVVGQLREGSGITMTNCTAKNVNVIGYRDIGAVLGMASNNNIISNCKASDSEVSYLFLEPGQKYDGNTNNGNIGEVIGRRGNNVVENSNTSSNVTLNTEANAYMATTSARVKEILAKETDGVTIYLQKGTYSDLSFVNPSTFNAKNLTLIGEEGTVINGISFHGEIGGSNWRCDVDGLTVKNVTFSSGILFGSVDHKNILIENCKFINNARISQGGNNETVTDLTVKNCSFTGNGTGTTTAIILDDPNGLTVTGCTFTNIQFNAVQIGRAKGTVLIDGNNINGTGDRVFRFVDVLGDMTISNNTIISNGDSNGELAKTSSASQITLKNNTWNGMTDAEVANKLINITAK